MAGFVRAGLASPKPALTCTRNQPSSRTGVVGRCFTVPSPPLLCLILKDVSDASKVLAYHMGRTKAHIQLGLGVSKSSHWIQGCQGLVTSGKVSHDL